VGKHEQQEDNRLRVRQAARRVMHPFVHVAALVVLHLIAVTILETTPLVDLLPH
jgi:hypothetical protein